MLIICEWCWNKPSSGCFSVLFQFFVSGCATALSLWIISSPSTVSGCTWHQPSSSMVRPAMWQV